MENRMRISFMPAIAAFALSACATAHAPIPERGAIRADSVQYGCPSKAEAWSRAHNTRCAVVTGAAYRVIEQGPGWALVELAFEDGPGQVYIASRSAR
jgi:hypothetical protein